MITISISPQTPAHMAILGQALAALLAGDSEAPTVKKPRKAAEASALTPVAVETATATPTLEVAPAEPVAASPSKAITLEQVRAKLATLSQAGKQAEIKALVVKFGAAKLTDVAAEHYAELMTAAEAM